MIDYFINEMETYDGYFSEFIDLYNHIANATPEDLAYGNYWGNNDENKWVPRFKEETNVLSCMYRMRWLREFQPGSQFYNIPFTAFRYYIYL